jgi:hypothetical protein
MENLHLLRMARLNILHNILQIHSLSSKKRLSKISIQAITVHATTPQQVLTTKAIIALGMKAEQDISHVVFTMLDFSLLQINAVHVVVENLNIPGLSRLQTLMESMMVNSVHTL